MIEAGGESKGVAGACASASLKKNEIIKNERAVVDKNLFILLPLELVAFLLLLPEIEKLNRGFEKLIAY